MISAFPEAILCPEKSVLMMYTNCKIAASTKNDLHCVVLNVNMGFKVTLCYEDHDTYEGEGLNIILTTSGSSVREDSGKI